MKPFNALENNVPLNDEIRGKSFALIVQMLNICVSWSMGIFVNYSQISIILS